MMNIVMALLLVLLPFVVGLAVNLVVLFLLGLL